MNAAKMHVSLWAVTQRINRILAQKNKLLLESGDHKTKADNGDWYIMDTSTNTITDRNFEIEKLAREVGALKFNETV